MKSDIYILAYLLIITNHPFFGASLLFAIVIAHITSHKR